jgi:hypothetical protein
MRAAYIRIRCRAPRTTVGGLFVPAVTTLPDWTDVQVAAVLDDGREVDLSDVVGNCIEWVASAGTKPPQCHLEVLSPEIEVDGVGVLTLVEPEDKADCYYCGSDCKCGAR